MAAEDRNYDQFIAHLIEVSGVAAVNEGGRGSQHVAGYGWHGERQAGRPSAMAAEDRNYWLPGGEAVERPGMAAAGGGGRGSQDGAGRQHSRAGGVGGARGGGGG